MDLTCDKSKVVLNTCLFHHMIGCVSGLGSLIDREIAISDGAIPNLMVALPMTDEAAIVLKQLLLD